MNTNTNTGGPAFPVVDYTQPDGRGNHIMTITGGMTMRQYAAIKLRVPNSGTDWLDEMIVQSLRDGFAAKAMDGFNREMVAYEWGEDVTEHAAKRSYEIADAMLKARGQ